MRPSAKASDTKSSRPESVVPGQSRSHFKIVQTRRAIVRTFQTVTWVQLLEMLVSLLQQEPERNTLRGLVSRSLLNSVFKGTICQNLSVAAVP